MSANAILTIAVEHWERRRRWSVVLEALPVVMLPGLAAGAVLAFYSRVRPGVADTASLTIGLGGALVGVIALLVWVWVIKARTPVESARWFDLNFGLQERISTALELGSGRIKADGELAARQVADAEKIVSRVKAAALLPFSTDWRMWVLNLALLAVLAFMMLVVPPVALADGVAERERAAIDAAADEVSEIIEDIAADPNLTEEQREPLLNALQTQLETLRDPNLTLDEALATLGEVQSTLSESAADVQADIAQQEQAEAAASAAMQEFSGSPDTQSLQQSIEGMESGLESMTEEQMQQAAQALEQAAQSLEQTNPEAAQALREAAEALQQGDMQAAQESLQRAAAEAERAAGERGQQEQQRGTMQQGAEQAQSAQQQAAESGESQEAQQGEGQEGQPSEGQQGEGQQGDGSTGPFSSQGEMQSDSGNSPASPSDAAQQGEGESEGEFGRGGDGQGDGAADLSQDASAQAQNAGDSDSDPNNPDGGGERDYQSVFAPRFSVEAEGDDEIRLGADPGDQPLTEGEFDDNPTGTTVVPYNQVFSSYADAASRALESDYIPLGMRDVVRDYFSSLDPQQP